MSIKECQSRTIANRGGMVLFKLSVRTKLRKSDTMTKKLLVFKMFLHDVAISRKTDNCCVTVGNCPFLNHEFIDRRPTSVDTQSTS